MMEDFAPEPACLMQDRDGCGPMSILCSATCSNHLLVEFLCLILVVTFLINALIKMLSIRRQNIFNFYSRLKIAGVAINGSLGLAYFGVFLWILVIKLANGTGLYPIHSWLAFLCISLTWVSACLMAGMRLELIGGAFAKAWVVALIILDGFLCASSILDFIVGRKRNPSVKFFLDILSLPEAVLMLVLVIKMSKTSPESDYTGKSLLYERLRTEPDGHSADLNDHSSVTLFAHAGVFSKLSFWWLNPLMKKGNEKPLEEKDIPMLSKEDEADTRYTLFLEQLMRLKQKQQASSPPILKAIVACHLDQILISGLFAMLKVITLSSGPMLLKAFIKVTVEPGSSKYEGFVLALALFLAKVIESLSQRQWYFRARRLGLQVRSLLSSAIYQKQLRLSNSAKFAHSSGVITNYVTVDAYRIGEFPFWFHQIWATVFQLCVSLLILYNAVGLATIAAMIVIIITVLSNVPLGKLQNKFQTKLMEAQDERLKAMSEAIVSMKVLKLYAWETHFKKVIEGLRGREYKWLKASQLRRAYNNFLHWSSPMLVSAATFSTCYFLKVPLDAGNVFTFVATLRLVQDPVRKIPDIIGVFIQAKVAFARIVRFLDAPELQTRRYCMNLEKPVVITSASFSWDEHFSKPTLRNISLEISAGEKVAICGEVGSGKSSLLAAVLGEIAKTEGLVRISGKIAYVSQNAWIQSGTLRDNVLFGSVLDEEKYQETLKMCSLVKDIEMLPFGDLTEIGERGVNLSGGQKQRVQLARALYQDADIYLLDDPFSAVDAHIASSLFNEYVMRALSSKTVLLVTHQVDFLPAFNSILLMSDGAFIASAAFHELLSSSKEFHELVNAHRQTIRAERPGRQLYSDDKRRKATVAEICDYDGRKHERTESTNAAEQLIKKEERERGDTGLKPYKQYLSQNNGYLYASICALTHILFLAGQISQNMWMAAKVQNPEVTTLRLIVVYMTFGFFSVLSLLFRCVFTVILGIQSSTSLFSQLLNSLFHAPMSFFDSTPLGRILTRVSSDLNLADQDVPFAFVVCLSATFNVYSNIGVLSSVTWQILFVALPLIYLAIRLQRYYLASSKEMMRINGTAKSLVANHLAESVLGAVTIRAFEEEGRFFSKSLELIDRNASPYFHNFAASEWLIQRLEIMSAFILSSSALVMALLPTGTFSPGFVGLALSYGLSLNISFVLSIQNQCTLANHIISVERLNHYMHVPSEAPEIIQSSRPPVKWPSIGRVELQKLQIRYMPDSPLVIHGISCVFEGGHKIGIVGRTGSGKTTLIGALFRLVEPAGGKIVIDGIDVAEIGLHDLRSRFGIIPQDPTLFRGSVRYNLDPLGAFEDRQIWEVLEKCQLREAVQEKGSGLDSLVFEDGLNWSMGQRQLFCLGRALLKKSRILVLDEATASIDNATDAILQRTIRTEFADCTVITVAHRIPTVMDCSMVLVIADGRLIEYDEPDKLMSREGSLFRELVTEYWSHDTNRVAYC